MAVALVAGLIVGVLVTSGIFLSLDEAGTPTPCPEGSAEATFAMPEDKEVKVCHPTTWFTDTILTIDSAGREVPARVGVLKAFRADGDQNQRLKPQFITWTLAELVISPAPAAEFRPTGCGSVPFESDGEMMMCHSAATWPGPEPNRPISHNVMYVTTDDYFIRARVELLFDLLSGPPSSEQYAYLEETWPGLQAEIKQIAQDFARREGERE